MHSAGWCIEGVRGAGVIIYFQCVIYFDGSLSEHLTNIDFVYAGICIFLKSVAASCYQIRVLNNVILVRDSYVRGTCNELGQRISPCLLFLLIWLKKAASAKLFWILGNLWCAMFDHCFKHRSNDFITLEILNMQSDAMVKKLTGMLVHAM